jgi:hypothetical protein
LNYWGTASAVALDAASATSFLARALALSAARAINPFLAPCHHVDVTDCTFLKKEFVNSNFGLPKDSPELKQVSIFLPEFYLLTPDLSQSYSKVRKPLLSYF